MAAKASSSLMSSSCRRSSAISRAFKITPRSISSRSASAAMVSIISRTSSRAASAASDAPAAIGSCPTSSGTNIIISTATSKTSIAVHSRRRKSSRIRRRASIWRARASASSICADSIAGRAWMRPSSSSSAVDTRSFKPNSRSK